MDPIIHYCSHHLLPLPWHALQGERSRAARTFMSEAGEFGLRGGISTPVHGPHGELGILSFAHDGSLRAEDVEHAVPAVHLLAGYLHEAVPRVTGVASEREGKKLSQREVDCLRWAAEGKTSWEVSRLCNISERTVNFHLANVVRKLNAKSRQHAIAKAVLLGSLRPRPF